MPVQARDAIRFRQWGTDTVKDTDPDIAPVSSSPTIQVFSRPEQSSVPAPFAGETIIGHCNGCGWRRRCGAKNILARRWPLFIERFGDFVIEAPLSDAMRAFVRRHGSDAQACTRTRLILNQEQMLE